MNAEAASPRSHAERPAELGRVLINAYMLGFGAKAEIFCSIRALPVLTQTGNRRACWNSVALELKADHKGCHEDFSSDPRRPGRIGSELKSSGAYCLGSNRAALAFCSPRATTEFP